MPTLALTSRPRLACALAALLSTCVFAVACGDDGAPSNSNTNNGTTSANNTGTSTNSGTANNTTTTDAGTDTDPDDTGVTDTDPGDVPADIVRPDPESPVELDWQPWTENAPDPNDSASVRELTDDSPPFPGDSTQARSGDFMLENGVAAFVIERDFRAMSPCPYGGNVIDTSARDADGAWSEDILGEICPLFNVGLTFKPEAYTVLAEGGPGEAAVLRVDGGLEVWDFLNLEGVVGDFIPGFELDLAIDPSRIVPARVSMYYVLRPGDHAMRVVSSIRNDEDQVNYVALSHLLRSAGKLDFFNPLNSLKGFGYESIGANNIAGDPMPFIGMVGETSSVWYAPARGILDEERNGIPISGSHVSVSGVTVTLLGSSNLLGTALTPEAQLDNAPGITRLEPGQHMAWQHWHGAGTGALAPSLDLIYDRLEIETGTLEGVITDGADGAPQAGLKVSAINGDGRVMSQAITDDAGGYRMNVPPGAYIVRARDARRFAELAAPAQIDAGATREVNLEAAAGGLLTVNVTDPNGDPVPARVRVICDGACPNAATSQDKNITNNRLPSDTAAIAYADFDGVARIPLQPGSYRVAVSRGLEWSVWPGDGPNTPGEPLTIGNGDTPEMNAELAHVLDTTGAMSGDFHVHAIHSSDSPVPNATRVMNFVSEGLDVIVSTDHDYITDFAPTIEALGAGGHLTSIIGAEITTSDTGHLNSFPLPIDPDHPYGGALDWGNGPDNALTPAQVFEWAQSNPGDQVIQINHPRSAGTIGSLGADVLLGTTTATAERKRLNAPPEDAKLDALDTGLWSEAFTAIEVMNGNNRDALWTIMRWWMTMIGRGFTPTATGVTDTHQQYSDLGGIPRSFVSLPEGQDSLETFDDNVFSSAVNQGRLLVTNGPFMRVTAVNAQGDRAGLGDTLEVGGEQVTLEIDLQTPSWMRVDQLDLFINPDGADIYRPDAGVNTDPITAALTQPIELTEDDLEVVAEGTRTHSRYRKQITVTLDVPDDAFLVVMVRGDNSPNMQPVVPSNAKPLAFTNPIYFDADGGGYNTYPLADLVEARIQERAEAIANGSGKPTRALRDDAHHDADHADHDGHLGHVSRAQMMEWVEQRDPRWILAVYEYARCRHD